MARHADTGAELTPQPTTGDGDQPEATEIAVDSASPGDTDEMTDEHDAIDEPEATRRWMRSTKTAARGPSPVNVALAVAVAIVVALGALSGWLGYQLIVQHRAQDQRNMFVQVAKQGALNLTTIDWQHADADVARILESATGEFYDDFSKRSQPFVDVVKQAQSKSEGTITEAGLESETGEAGQVLVAVSVKTTNISAIQQEPRRWKMRLTVQTTGPDAAKVSSVVFVQ